MRDAKSHLTENTQTKDAKCLDRVQTKIWGIQICTMCAKIPIKPYITVKHLYILGLYLPALDVGSIKSQQDILPLL